MFRRAPAGIDCLHGGTGGQRPDAVVGDLPVVEPAGSGAALQGIRHRQVKRGAFPPVQILVECLADQVVLEAKA